MVISDSFTARKPQLVGGLEYFLFFHILGIIIPTDELIFFRRGRSTTNQTKSTRSLGESVSLVVSLFLLWMHRIIELLCPRKSSSLERTNPISQRNESK